MDIKFTRMILGDWFRRLALEADLPLNQYGSSGESYNYGSPKELHVKAEFIEDPPYLKFVSSELKKQPLIESLAQKAIQNLKEGYFGGITWHSTTVVTSNNNIGQANDMGTFLQLLGAQTRILEWRRLGRDVLLEFTEENSENTDEKKPLLAPKTLVHIHIAIPSPCAGHYSSFVAHGVLEIVAAICTFALGRGVDLPPTIFPAKDEDLEKLNSLHLDKKILTLARKGVGLDIFSQLSVPGGIDVFLLLRSAFLSFDAAVKQQHDAVACILFVVVAEALTSPNQSWRSEKLTKRFIEFYEDLIPEALDKIIGHGNFEEVFSVKRGTKNPKALRKKLLNKIYSYRSGNLHEGIKPSYMGLGASVEMHETVRRGIFLDFSEASILEFIKSPRVSLIGHPNFI